jgi:ketosteroid isomerase-like protein
MSSVPQSAATFTSDRLESFFDACNAHDVDRIVDFFTPDGVYLASVGPEDDGTSFRGVDEVKRGFTAFFTMYPDGHYSDLEVMVHGDTGVASWTFRGSTASGAKLTYRGVDLFEFVGDRIDRKDAFRKERSNPIGS